VYSTVLSNATVRGNFKFDFSQNKRIDNHYSLKQSNMKHKIPFRNTKRSTKHTLSLRKKNNDSGDSIIRKQAIQQDKTAENSSAIVPPSLNLIIQAGQILNAQKSRLFRDPPQSLFKPPIMKLKKALGTSPKNLNKTINQSLMCIQRDQSLDWKKVCKPLPAKPRLPKIVDSTKHSADVKR
jgi:hypothetical protein